MTPPLALLVFGSLIATLFLLDRDSTQKTSVALWISIVWLLIGGSRPVSQWLAGLTGTGGQITEVSKSSDLYQDGSPLDRNILITLLVLAIIVVARRGPVLARVLRQNWAILAFLLYGGVSVLWSDYPDVAFKRWIKVVGNLIMILVIVTDSSPIAAVKKVLARTGFILITLSVLLIKYFPDLGRGYHPWEWTPYYTGVTTNKNELGMICLTFGLYSTWRVIGEFSSAKKKRRLAPTTAHIIVLLMLAWLFYMANSMTSLSCFLMATSLMVGLSLPFAKNRAVVHVCVVAILAIATTALFLDIGAGLVRTLGRDPTLTGRTEIWHMALKMTENSLFGTGFESFWLGDRLKKIWSIYWWHPNEAHNGYIELYLNLGWIGISLMAGMIVMGYRNVIRSFRRDPENGKLRLAYFISALAYNFTEAGFRMICPVFTVFLLAITSFPENLASANVVPDPEVVSIYDAEDAARNWWHARDEA